MDINELSTQTLVQLQRVVSHELLDREHSIDDHLLRSHEKEEVERKDIEDLKKEKDRLTMEKE